MTAGTGGVDSGGCPIGATLDGQMSRNGHHEQASWSGVAV